MASVNPLAETHVPLKINIFDQTQNALVRHHLTIDLLIQDILREFAQELDLNRKYILLYEGRQLDPETIVGEANFNPDKEIVFGYYEPVRAVNATSAMSPSVVGMTVADAGASRQGVLREALSQREFPVTKEITVIGRGGAGENIDVDLSGFPEGRTVSRPHARIIQTNGQFMIEALKEDRPVMINDSPLPFGQRHMLRAGNVIGLGKIQLHFDLR